MISGNRRIPLAYSNQKAKEPIFMKYVPASQRTVKIGCVCPPPPSVDVIGVGTGSNTLLYSYDGGINWFGAGNSIFTEGNCASWNGTIWVAGGTGSNALAYSYDGITWTGLGQISTGPASTMTRCTSVVWSGSKWVAVDGSGQCATSTNGIDWIGFNGTNNNTYPAYLATDGSTFVGIPSASFSDPYGPAALSSNGESWTAVYFTDPPVEVIGEYRDILWDGTNFIVLVGQRDNPANSKFYSSTGSTWTGLPIVGYANGTNIGKTIGNLYISRGTDPNSTEKSIDGTTWTTVTNPSFPIVSGIPGTIFGTDKYIIICGYNNNNFIYSSDGVGWSTGTTNLSGNLKAGFFKN